MENYWMDSDSDGEDYKKTTRAQAEDRGNRWQKWLKDMFVDKKLLEVDYGLFAKKRLRQFIGSRYRVEKDALIGIQVLFHKYLYNLVFQIVTCYGQQSFLAKVQDPASKKSPKWTVKVSLDMIAKLFPKPVPEDIALSISFIRISKLHSLMNKYALYILHTLGKNTKHVEEVYIKEDSVRMLEKGYIFGLLLRTAIAEVRELLAKITSLVEVNQRKTITSRDVETVAALTPWAETCLPSQHPFRLFRGVVEDAKKKKSAEKSKPKKTTKKAPGGKPKPKPKPKPKATKTRAIKIEQPAVAPRKATKTRTGKTPIDVDREGGLE